MSLPATLGLDEPAGVLLAMCHLLVRDARRLGHPGIIRAKCPADIESLLFQLGSVTGFDALDAALDAARHRAALPEIADGAGDVWLAGIQPWGHA